MKKLNKVIAVSGSVWFALASYGCGKTDIYAKCCADGDSLIIDVPYESADRAGDFTNFRSRSSLSELKNEIDETSDGKFTTRVYEEYLLWIEKGDQSNAHYYMVIRNRVQNDINSYTFTSPSIWMQGQPMAVPCHFLDLSDEIARMQPGEVFELRENKKYHTENTAADFYEFYRTIGAYQCEERDDGVTVSYTDKDENQTTMLVLVEQEQEGMSVAFQSVM